MADECDVAQARMEIEEAMRARAHSLMAPPLEATGECLWCGEPLAAGMRFCDVDCRDDYERRNK